MGYVLIPVAIEKLLLWLGIGTTAAATGVVIADNMNEANKAAGSSQSGTTSYTDACSSCQPPEDDDENKSRGERNKEYQKQAEKMGYRKVSRIEMGIMFPMDGKYLMAGEIV